jgi:hypothetical protein
MIKKIALFTIAVGKDPVYFESVKRYLPYNKKYFGQNHNVDYYLFTDRDEKIDGITSIPCKSSSWPYTTLLKNNMISDYLNNGNKWDNYNNIFFIDADFAIGDTYDFFNHHFLLVEPYWNNSNGGGFFYGGKSTCFKKLCDAFYNEIEYICKNKLPVPRDLDEYYLGLFRHVYKTDIHIIKMDRKANTLIFYDNEDLDEKIMQQGSHLFLQPFKSEGRANKTFIKNYSSKREMECIVNLDDKYIFDNYTYDFGRLLQVSETDYRILWSKHPESREILNIKENTISFRLI